MADLETVDIPAVEVLSTGGPVRGVGSPPEGDYWTREDLEKIAAANRELASQVRPPNKIGHSDAQTLVKNSALPAATPGEMPAVGWLDGSTARVVDGDDGVEAVLVMDAKAVPKKFSQLVDVGAYRTRSAELSRITDQVTQKTYDWVVTGLAWLGAKLPAVQTLDDVVALYEAAGLDVSTQDGIDTVAGARAYVVYAAEPAVVWAPDESFQQLRDAVARALNGPATGGMNEPRFWVHDVSVDGTRALVHDYFSDGGDGYVIPFTRSDDGDVAIAPSSDWTPVEEGWVAAARELARKNERPAESRAMQVELNDDQVAALREKLGIEGDTITPEALVDAAESRANELAEAQSKADAAESRLNEADTDGEKVRQLEADLKQEKRRSFESRRDADITKAQREGRLTQADDEVEKWHKRYESVEDGGLGEDAARELLFERPVDETLIREFGSDDRGGDEDDAVHKAYEAEIARNTGVPVEELI